ncbi:MULTISPECIES: hypothetical protein [unclassified Gemella]|uniref:hypothetical protein n=1 Tax=unclassified Gemella TaxID=2624949 RepID=UPI001C05583F|nr:MULTISPECIES: hypothetical protein [unclassified Gemella]MBU0278316.1 hypothetical protein [Gemella sp. zg-1178]QWQ38179.1 hypothetical protein KMP11_04215 [Gemella sp. zg-570]
MENFNFKNYVLLIIAVIIIPVLLFLITTLANTISKKNITINNFSEVKIANQVPEEAKKENSIPAANSTNKKS